MSVQVKGSGTIGGLDEGLVVSGIVTSSTQINVGSNIKIGNAGVGTFSSINSSTSPNFIIKDGTTEKGYIGFNANDPFIGRKNGVGVAFQNNKIRPVDGDDGSGSNNTVDIGENSYKFKDAYFSGTVTANSYAGDGSNLTGITGTTINNNADNRVITGSGTANTLNGESSVIIDSSGNLIIDAAGVGNASVYARNIFISGSSNNGITIHTTDTSGINRKCCLFFGTGTSVADMADGMLFYDHAGQYMHFSVNGAGTGVTKSSIRLSSDGTVRFDSTPTTTNSISILIKSHKARAVGDNNGILFRDANDHSQGAINVEKKSTSNATSDLVFRTSEGAVTTTLQATPERMRITSVGQVKMPHQPSFYATANSGGTVTMTSTHTLTNWRLSTSGRTYDVGSNFNTSNGSFTAPIQGTYLFTGSILLQQYDQASGIHMMWRKNGSTMQYWYNTRTSDIDRSGYGGYLAQGSTTTFTLNANDYVDVACNFSGSLKLWCGDANWGHFSGHFLG